MVREQYEECKGGVGPFANDSIPLEKPSHCSPGFAVVLFSSRVLLSLAAVINTAPFSNATVEGHPHPLLQVFSTPLTKHTHKFLQQHLGLLDLEE